MKPIGAPGLMLMAWRRPLLHACVSHGLTACHGVEIDFIKCAKANAFVALSAQRLKAKMAGPTVVLPSIECCAIEDVSSATPSPSHFPSLTCFFNVCLCSSSFTQVW